MVKREVIDLVKAEIKKTKDAIHSATVNDSDQLKALNVSILDLL